MKHLAVLIDAENVGAKNWAKIRAHIGAIPARITVCRVFGNLAEDRMSKWLKVAEEEALQPVMQFAGSNACDIAIAVSAMDLLHSGKLQGICLVSSDGDFTPLVHRLRAGGLEVYGYGSDKTAQRLQRACTAFTQLAELAGDVPKKKAAA